MEAIIYFYLAFAALTLGAQIMAYMTHKAQQQKHG
jgi:hypothetical protein